MQKKYRIKPGCSVHPTNDNLGASWATCGNLEYQFEILDEIHSCVFIKHIDTGDVYITKRFLIEEIDSPRKLTIDQISEQLGYEVEIEQNNVEENV